MSETAKAARTKREYEETQDAFDKVRQALIDALLASPLEASLVREKLYLSVQSLDAVRVCMEQVISTGEIERHVEEMREQLAKS